MKHLNLSASVYRILLVVLVGLLVLGNLGRIPLNDRVAVYLQDGVLLGMFIWTLAHHNTALSVLKKIPWLKPFAVFALCLIVSLGIAFADHSLRQVVIGLAYATRFFLYAQLVIYLLIGQSKKYITPAHIFAGLTAIAVSIACIGLVQYVFMPDMRFLQFMGYDDHYYRLISTYFDPPFTAQLIIVGLFVAYGLQTTWKKKLPMLITLFVALMLTYSRAEYLAFIAGVVVLLFQTGKKMVVGVVGLLIIAVFLLPRPASEGARLERTQSIIARATVLRESIQAMDAKTFLVGNGWYLTNANRQVRSGIAESHSSSSDNSYFQVLQSVGVFGLAAFLWFLWSVIKMIRHDTVLLPAMISILVGSLSNNILFFPAIMLVFWALLSTRKPTVA